MKKFLVVLFCTIMPLMAIAGDNSYKISYDGGTLPDTKAGTGLRMYLESNRVRIVKDKVDLVTIPASAITEISYGQDVHRRVGTAVAVGLVSSVLAR